MGGFTARAHRSPYTDHVQESHSEQCTNTLFHRVRHGRARQLSAQLSASVERGSKSGFALFAIITTGDNDALYFASVLNPLPKFKTIR
jgi:hypothetical protein